MVATAKSEAAEIKRFGGTPQPNSGRGKHNKGDAIIDKFVVDVKEYGRSFGLSIPMWAKICTDAIKQGKRPALNVVLGEGPKRVRMWVISESDMMEYLEFLEERDEG
jgi:hypothetical protein